MYTAEIEVELSSTNEADAEQEAHDMALVSTANLGRLLAVLDGRAVPEGHTVRSIIEAVRSDLRANES